MEINNELVELVNARLKDLEVEAMLVAQFEFAEEELGVKNAAGAKDDLLKNLSKKVKHEGELKTSDDLKDAINEFKNKVSDTLQMDRIRMLLIRNGLGFEASKNIAEIKDANLEEILTTLGINKEELE